MSNRLYFGYPPTAFKLIFYTPPILPVPFNYWFYDLRLNILTDWQADEMIAPCIRYYTIVLNRASHSQIIYAISIDHAWYSIRNCFPFFPRLENNGVLVSDTSRVTLFVLRSMSFSVEILRVFREHVSHCYSRSTSMNELGAVYEKYSKFF